MRWIAIMAFFLVLSCSARAAGSDEQYLNVYNEIHQADGLAESGHSAAAALSYLQAQTDLRDLQARQPAWNPELVNFRLDYLAEKLQSLSKYLPSTNAPPVVAPPPVQPSVMPQPSTAAVTQQIAGLQEQIRSLIDANTVLQAKLKEALSVQPAAVSPAELAKAEAKILMLEKEKDLLTVALDQQKAASASAMTAAKAAAADQEIATWKARADAIEQKSRKELARAHESSAELEKKLAEANKRAKRVAKAPTAEVAKQIPEERDQLKAQQAEIAKDEAQIARLTEALLGSEKKMAAANRELDALKAARVAEAQSAEETKAVTAERDQLKEELAGHSKDLAKAEERANEELLSVRAALQQAEQRRDELEKKLADVPQANIAFSKSGELPLESSEPPPAAAPAIEPAAKPAPEPAAKTSPTNMPGFKNSIVLNLPVRAIVKCDALSVRGQGSFAGEVIHQLKKGESVTVLEEITSRGERPAEPDQWSRIAMPANTPVWVKAMLIDPETRTVRVSKLNVRGGPGEKYSIVAQLSQGAAVNEILEKEGWLEIETPTNACAFVASEYLQLPAPGVAVSLAPDTSPPPATAPVPANAPR